MSKLPAMTFGSLFSGVGGMDLGLERAGMTCKWQVEIDDYATRVLQKHWPDVPRWGDVKTFIEEIEHMGLRGPKKGKKYDQAAVLYEQGMSCEQIAEHFGVSRQTIHRALKIRGVDMRPQQRHGEDSHFFRGTEADNSAQDKLEAAIKAGKLSRRTICEECGRSGQMKDGRSIVQAHHDDYSRPLEVRWLCQNCHYSWHTTNSAKGAKRNSLRVDLICGGFP